MRTFGPGSISSYIRTTLDLAYGLLWIALAALLLSAAAGFLWRPFLGAPPHDATGPLAEADALLRRGWALPELTAGGAVWLGALLVVIDRLRRVFATMSAGDPFDPRNVRRLQEAGAALVVLQLAVYALRWAAADLFPRAGEGPVVDVSGLFAILVVFVLAEVFREGARLRADAELTI